jgi:hypothetical protein
MKTALESCCPEEKEGSCARKRLLCRSVESHYHNAETTLQGQSFLQTRHQGLDTLTRPTKTSRLH